MYYILENNDGEYYIEKRIGRLPMNIVGHCVKDPMGDVITDISCYNIKEKNDDLVINVNYKQWFEKKENR